ncbi:MAG: hypothetical protein JWN44_1801 [Myxococcales bacterium]|nr:hypothetical protein [Myxococcales bacterium]
MKSYATMMLLGLTAATGCKSAGGQAPPATPAVESAPAEGAATPDGGTEGAGAAEGSADGKPGEGKAEGGAGGDAKPAEAKPKSGRHEVDGRRLVMTGQGARVRDGEKLYDLQIWVDETDGRRAFPALAMRAGGRDKARLVRGDHAPAFIVWGRFNKQAVFKFAKAVPAATMREDLKSALESVPGADALLEQIDDADAGDEWVLTTRDNGEIELRLGDDKKEAPPNPKLQRALWNVWLGPRPLSVELRRQLIERIADLGR